MIVPVVVTSPNAFTPKLPPAIAKLGHDELFLIELQGTLEVQCPASTTKDGQLIGTLDTADMNKPRLLIGHHTLEGKVVGLPKPLGVLHKHVRDTGPSADYEEKGDLRWDVTAVVRKKVVFSKRPMPMAVTRGA